MKYFFDTEFIEDGKTIDLVSIGMVCEDGREFYRCSQEARLDLANKWVRDNVIPSLPHFAAKTWTGKEEVPVWRDRRWIKWDLLDFVTEGEKPEFWAYYADYDWVALCQLFGTMMDLPYRFPRFCMDLKQLSVMKGSPRHPSQAAGTEHDALQDAKWNKGLYEFLMAQEKYPNS